MKAGALAALLLALSLESAAGSGSGASLRFCGPDAAPSVADQDRMLRVAGLAKSVLDQAQAPVALVARSGTNLQRVGLRYSHAGLSLRDNAAGAWAVRQLYFDCDARHSRLFDEGLAGFLLGSSSPRQGFLSMVFLPPEAAQALAEAALDQPRALSVLEPSYSANAYTFGLQFQNCNQWVAELMAVAWAPPAATPAPSPPRAQAQSWLQAQGYAPAPVQTGRLLLWALNTVMPWVSLQDHPRADRAAGRVQTTVPEGIEAWLRSRYPEATRVELCHRGERVVLRRGWVPLPDDCSPGEGDEVSALD